MDHYGKVPRKTNPREKANVFSLFTFSYTGGLFRKAYKKELQDEDIYEVIKRCKSERVTNKFEKSWQKQIRKNGKCSLLSLLWKNFGTKLFLLGVLQLIWKMISSIYEPEAIGKLVSYFDPKTKLTFDDAIYYACLMIGLRFFHALYQQNYAIYLQHLAINVKNSLCSLVYRKSLKLSPAALNEMGLGNIITVMTRDVHVFERSVSMFTEMWIEIFRIVLVCYLIYNKMGPAGFAGIGCLFVILPAQVFVSRCIKNLRLELSKKTDERLQSTQETLSAIKIIKMYTWEQVFVEKVKGKRSIEMQKLLRASYLKSLNWLFGMFSSKVGLYILMMTYIAVSPVVRAEVIFYVMRSYNDLRHSLSILVPIALGQGADIIASNQRINRILNAEEVDSAKEAKYTDPKVKVSGVTVKVKDCEILKNISTEIKPGLTVVTGPLGCGKSSLLKLFLNDFPISEGKLLSEATFSYCSQDAWLFPSSIKQNIIFGEPLDELRYQTVVKVCALEYDFNLFDHGDETIVADGGKNLSGGQQARINLARAIYKKSDIYLLDDPLHALDPHVQAFIYKNCIKDFLKGVRCVLVTHNLNHKNAADNLIVLKEGAIVFDGHPTEVKAELIKEIELEDEKLKEQENKDDEEDAEETTGLIKASGDCRRRVYTEIKKEGKVDWVVFKKYFQFGGGFLAFFGIALLIISAESGESYSSRIFTNWINIQQNISNFKSSPNTTNATVITKLKYRADFSLKIYSALVGGSFLLDLLTQFLMRNFCRKASVRLHSAMIEKLSTAAMSFYDHYFIGNILNRFSQDLNIVDEILPMNINFFLMILFACFGAVALVSTVSSVFMIPAAILVLCLYLIRLMYMPAARSLKRLEAATRSPLIGHVNATIEGLTTIRASQVEHILADEFDRHQDLYTSASYMTFCIRKAFAFFMDILSALFVTFIVGKLLFWGAGELSGDVGLAITKASALAMMVQWSLIQWSDLENNMTHVERVLEYTEVPQDNYEGQVIKDWPVYGGIVFNNVSLTYKLEKVLKNLSFEVKPNHKIGIVGRTGAGKSSIIAALFRLYNFDGSILIDGVNIKTLALDFLREHISIIPQDPLLFQGTIRHNLDPLKRYTDEEVWQTLEKVHMKDHIPTLELEITDHGSNFSTGQRQLICLARAIIKKNKIVVLDEATANMDPETENLVQKTIASNFSNCTVFIIAHRLKSVLECNRILVMERGQVVEYADPTVLLENKNSYFSKMLVTDNSHHEAK
ncbi:probable multidrug resistance-associated protein lethal(2)03659 [Anthonomus grandis grandis]|uniref:probable multidrug resistance-associated protein lethal(2)03659 n=1 Tax=Anthonomus grandis grandis TaxID=2921223 RepID=UPI002165B628|nr:probable multidrug resistance-associated protein lethal(2)03659 [Anthonomus grandis grandis]